MCAVTVIVLVVVVVVMVMVSVCVCFVAVVCQLWCALNHISLWFSSIDHVRSQDPYDF